MHIRLQRREIVDLPELLAFQYFYALFTVRNNTFCLRDQVIQLDSPPLSALYAIKPSLPKAAVDQHNAEAENESLMPIL